MSKVKDIPNNMLYQFDSNLYVWNDEMITFDITRTITRASIDIVYLLHDEINRRYNAIKK